MTYDQREERSVVTRAGWTVEVVRTKASWQTNHVTRITLKNDLTVLVVTLDEIKDLAKAAEELVGSWS